VHYLRYSRADVTPDFGQVTGYERALLEEAADFAMRAVLNMSVIKKWLWDAERHQ